MVGDFHANEATKEMVLEEQRPMGRTDAELWDLAQDDYVGWLIRLN
jgi:hypothetical protein